jgi:[ribosomal protein S5]-alanine N-acetyltransferase
VDGVATERLVLVPATVELVDADLEGRLAHALGAELPEDWPPEFHGEPQLRFTREALAQPGAAGWWSHYIVVTTGERPVVIGTCGCKGPPDQDGTVEIGYSVVPSWQRRGLATEAVNGLVETAWERGATTVLAHTLPDRTASIAVLRKAGFASADPPEAGVLAFAILRA